MKKRNISVLALLLALGAAATACDESLTGDGNDVPTAIAIEPSQSLEVAEGETLELTAKDQSGNELSSGLSWWTTDESIATVNAIGVVTGVTVGTTMVHARLGELEDSVAVEVTFGEMALGAMDIVVTGDIEERFMIRSSNSNDEVLGVDADFVDHPEWAFGYLYGESWSSTSDVAIILTMPGQLAVGEHTVPAMEAMEDEPDLHVLVGLTQASAMMYMESETDEGFMYFSTGGTLEITEVNAPGGSFDNPTGSVRGTARFTADEYSDHWDAETGEEWVEATGRSIEVVVGFNIPAGAFQGGYMSLTADGGPYATAETLETPASGDVWSNTMYMWASAADSNGRDLWWDIEVTDPSVGTFTVGQSAAVWWDGPEDWSTSQSGTVTLSAYGAPTTSDWGLASGSVDLNIGFSDGSSMSVTGDMVVPLEPLSSGMSSLRAEEDRAGGDRFLKTRPDRVGARR